MNPRRTSSAQPDSFLPSSLRAAVLSVVSFEALTVLYLLAGLFKEDPRFAWIPGNPTVLFFALSVAVGALILALKAIVRQGLFPVFTCLALIVWLALSLSWSPSRLYGPDKVFTMATLVLWGLIAGAMIIAPDRERLRRLFFVLLLIALLAAFEAISVYLTRGGGTIAVGTTSYLGLGRVCGFGAIVIFVAWLFSRRRFGLYGLACLGLLALFVFVLFIGGGRGPLLATLGGFVIPFAAGITVNRRGLRLARFQAPILGLGLLAGAALMVWVQASERTPETVKRLERILQADEFSEIGGNRGQYYALAPVLWAEAPVIGHGAGAWPLLTHRPDAAFYPHNILAEAAVEGGAVGLGLLLALFAVALRPVTFARMRQDPLAMCVTMIFVTTFLNAMVSGDLANNRMLFVMFGLLTLFALPRHAASPQWEGFLKTPAPPRPMRPMSHPSATRPQAGR